MNYQSHRCKIFNDPIHGHIQIHPACVAIIDTEQFQRLRNLKQLALCYFIYPGASHNRFEHCIGVSHLAGQLVRAIRSGQPDLEITDKDVLCVEIAGLCHDLGHGPFSHLFDSHFMPSASQSGEQWKHEMGSVQMFEYLLDVNGLMQENGALRKAGLNETDIEFIKEQIYGPLPHNRSNNAIYGGSWPYKGRPEEKGFLYEVVANKRNNIDVDKWDYLSRDSYHLGIANSFDHQRIIHCARVLKEGNEWQICVRDKVVDDIYEMFLTRYKLHQSAYQHKVNLALEIMMTDALLAADSQLHLLMSVGDCEGISKISDCVKDMKCFQRLHDGIMHRILDSTSPELELSRSIIKRILRRNLYSCVAESQSINHLKLKYSRTQIENRLLEIANQKFGGVLSAQDFCVRIPRWDFGMGQRNPISELKVYRSIFVKKYNS